MSGRIRPFQLKTKPNRLHIDPFDLFAPHCLDSYKLGHKDQYTPGVEYVYSNFTPRNLKYLSDYIPDGYRDNKYVVYDLQGMLKDMKALWDKTFFSKPLKYCLDRYKARVPAFTCNPVTTDHLEALWNLGYLPLRMKTLDEGSVVDAGVPCMTAVNTLPEFGWLTNSLETYLSNESWKGMTIATISRAYRRIINDFAELTGSPAAFTDWQSHCFADRGMSGMMDAAKRCSGHSTSSLGTDSVSAMDYIDWAYPKNPGFYGGSVNATEHSIMCVDGKADERETYRRLITGPMKKGVGSIVSDTWDFWNVLTNIAPSLRAEIMAREYDINGLSKVVFRPDSGDPADILCGTARGVKELTWKALMPHFNRAIDQAKKSAAPWSGFITVECKGKYYKIPLTPQGKMQDIEVTPTPQEKGAVACLWDEFGGELTSKGYKAVMQRVGLIYGDSITLHRALDIFRRLADKGFASCNVVLGVGLTKWPHRAVTCDCKLP